MMTSEKEKMIAGELYRSSDAELIEERNKAKATVFEYNNTSPLEIDKRKEILCRLINFTDNDFLIEQPFYFDYGYNISIGKNFYSNFSCTILDCAPVTIGNNVMFGPHVALYTAGHPEDCEQRISGLEYAYPISIGENVWIGGNSVVLPGVTIGANTVIGAGSVVSKSIPPNVIAVGNPCRVLRACSASLQKL